MEASVRSIEYVYAPFDEEQLRNIRAFMNEGLCTAECPNDPGQRFFEVERHGLVCSVCGFIQTSVVETIATGAALKSWQAHVRALASVTQDTRELSL